MVLSLATNRWDVLWTLRPAVVWSQAISSASYAVPIVARGAGEQTARGTPSGVATRGALALERSAGYHSRAKRSSSRVADKTKRQKGSHSTVFESEQQPWTLAVERTIYCPAPTGFRHAKD